LFDDLQNLEKGNLEEGTIKFHVIFDLKIKIKFPVDVKNANSMRSTLQEL